MNPNMHGDGTVAGKIADSGGRRRSLWKTPALTTALILLVPLLGNYFVNGWHWSPGGFVVVGALLFGICFSYQLVTRNRDTVAYRAAVGIALAASLSLMWGSLVQFVDVNRAAVLYFGVPIVMVIGAAIARLRPIGMALALFATALVQGSALAIALTIMLIHEPHITFWTPPELRGFAGNGVVLLMFVVSALLFRKAARSASARGLV
jgi:hypothetical protein